MAKDKAIKDGNDNESDQLATIEQMTAREGSVRKLLAAQDGVPVNQFACSIMLPRKVNEFQVLVCSSNFTFSGQKNDVRRVSGSFKSREYSG